MPHLGEARALGQVVEDLRGVRHSGHLLAHTFQALGDEVGGALVSKAKHHGRADVKSVALALEVSCAAAGHKVPGCDQRCDQGYERCNVSGACELWGAQLASDGKLSQRCGTDACNGSLHRVLHMET